MKQHGGLMWTEYGSRNRNFKLHYLGALLSTTAAICWGSKRGTGQSLLSLFLPHLKVLLAISLYSPLVQISHSLCLNWSAGKYKNVILNVWTLYLLKIPMYTSRRLRESLRSTNSRLEALLLGLSQEKAMTPHSSTLAWKIPWTEEPSRLQSMRSLRVGHSWTTSLSLFTFMHWRRKCQPTPVFLPGESQGQKSLVGGCLWGRTESDTTKAT